MAEQRETRGMLSTCDECGAHPRGDWRLHKPDCTALRTLYPSKYRPTPEPQEREATWARVASFIETDVLPLWSDPPIRNAIATTAQYVRLGTSTPPNGPAHAEREATAARVDPSLFRQCEDEGHAPLSDGGCHCGLREQNSEREATGPYPAVPPLGTEEAQRRDIEEAAEAARESYKQLHPEPRELPMLWRRPTQEREATEARGDLALQLRRHANEADENGAVELALDLREAASVLRTQEERPTEGPASEPTHDADCGVSVVGGDNCSCGRPGIDCPKCGAPPRDHEIRHWGVYPGDADHYCGKCGSFVRMRNSG